MTAWTAGGVADWEALQGRRDAMWQKPSWAKGVLVDNASPSTGSKTVVRAVQVPSCPPTDAPGASIAELQHRCRPPPQSLQMASYRRSLAGFIQSSLCRHAEVQCMMARSYTPAMPKGGPLM